MMDAFDLASRLFGNSRAESRGDVPNSLDILTATGAGESSDGAANVYIDADVTPADDYDGDDYAIGIPTSPNVIEGDGVLVGLTGSGPLKTPVVISNPGSGDRMQVQISNAETLAEQAEAVATATGQHFWSDTDGAHVTEATREDWETTHTGANSIWNSLGMLFRDGLNNLLAVLTSGIAIYDGNGNAASNILAEFTANLVRIGGRLLGTGTSTASVQFFESDASQTDITATHVVGSTTPPTGPDDVYGVNHGVQVTTSTDDSELGGGAEGHAAWAALDLFADVNPDYEAGQALLKATTGGTPYDSSTDPTLGVLRQVADNGTEASRIYGSASEIQLNDTARYRTGVVTVEQAIAALTTPITSRSDNVSSMSASTDVLGGALTLAAGTYLIDIDATIATSSGSGTRSLTVGIYKGGSVASYRTFGESDRAYKRIGITEVMHFASQTSIQAYIQSSVSVSSSSSIRTRAVRLS